MYYFYNTKLKFSTFWLSTFIVVVYEYKVAKPIIIWGICHLIQDFNINREKNKEA